MHECSTNCTEVISRCGETAGKIVEVRLLSRAAFVGPVLTVAPSLLGRVLIADSADGRVAVRLTEVEAYAGEADPASHAGRGRTPRSEIMYGPPGHVYVYFVYGMHWCANIVTGPDGAASAVLLRAGEVVEGIDLARQRRPHERSDFKLASGPARLARVLGLDGRANGLDLCEPNGALRVAVGRRTPAERIMTGPRIGVTNATDRPWRYFEAGATSVTAYRAGGRRRPIPVNSNSNNPAHRPTLSKLDVKRGATGSVEPGSAEPGSLSPAD